MLRSLLAGIVSATGVVLSALAATLVSTALPTPSAAQTLPRGIMITGTPHTVWSWSSSPKCGGGQDFPDVPARPFMVGDTVRWFASNAGNYASVGTGGGRDILATLQRGVTAGKPGCVQSVASTPRQAKMPYYPGSVPATYNTALWLASPFNDGTTVHALLHNEFHGDWTGDLTWCANQTQTVYLPCSYWNIVSASSSDGGVNFKLNQSSSGVNVPAIALAQPYAKPTGNEPGPQGMTAQSNILQSGGYYYVLALQLLVAPDTASPLNGTCIWRAPVASGPLVWTGWDGTGWTVASPASYPATSQLATSPPLCKPVLPGPFRASWTFNGLAGNGVVVFGQDTLANMKTRNARMNGCPYAPGASASTADAAFTYIVANNLPVTVPNMPAPGSTNWPLDRLEENQEVCLLQINSINTASTLTRHAYPSLLDPASATFGNGDLNFQYSGYLPYLYFTQMNPTGPQNLQGWDRDLVRIAVQVFPSQSMDAPIKGR